MGLRKQLLGHFIAPETPQKTDGTLDIVSYDRDRHPHGVLSRLHRQFSGTVQFLQTVMRAERDKAWEEVKDRDHELDPKNLERNVVISAFPGVPNFFTKTDKSLIYFNPFKIISILKKLCSDNGLNLDADEYVWPVELRNSKYFSKGAPFLGRSIGERNLLSTPAYYIAYLKNEQFRSEVLDGAENKIRTDLARANTVYLTGHSFGCVIIHDALRALFTEEPELFEGKTLHLIFAAPPFSEPVYGHMRGGKAVDREELVQTLQENSAIVSVIALGMENDALAGTMDVFDDLTEDVQRDDFNAHSIRGLSELWLGRGPLNFAAHVLPPIDKAFVEQAHLAIKKEFRVPQKIENQAPTGHDTLAA